MEILGTNFSIQEICTWAFSQIFFQYPLQRFPQDMVKSTGKPWLHYAQTMMKHTGTVHLRKLTWNQKITHLQGKIIFQTSIIVFHLNFQKGVSSYHWIG